MLYAAPGRADARGVADALHPVPVTMSVQSMLCPEPPRRLRGHRLLGVALRTAHLLAVGTLLGGHVFDVAAERLVPFLVAAIVTGAGMVALELAATCAWLFMGKGLAVVLKLALLLLVPAFWEQRVFVLVAVTVVAGFGSHMSARFRHHSLLAGREGSAVRFPLGRGVADERPARR
jgi:hypothetical protein